MTDWNAIAEARSLDIPADEIETVAPVLDALENTVRPLLTQLSWTDEPALGLSEPNDH
jgi:hypothetical protein